MIFLLAALAFPTPPKSTLDLGFLPACPSESRALVATEGDLRCIVHPGGLRFESASGSGSHAIDIGCEDPAPSAGHAATIVGVVPLAGSIHVLRGNDPAAFAIDLPHFARARVSGLAPGIDLEVGRDGNGFEYDVVAGEGADLASFELVVRGAESVEVGANGELEIAFGGGRIVQRAPRTFAIASDGARRPLASSVVLRGGDRIGFRVAATSGAERVVVDPGLAYSTYIGSTLFDEVTGIAVDVNDTTVVCGTTNAANFPVSVGSYDTSFGGTFSDAFVARISATGSLLWATFLGGSGTDGANALALAPDGRIHVAGRTQSTNFPIVPGAGGAIDASANGGIDAFALALTADGKNLTYSTYFGGAADDEASGLAIGSAGEIYLAGYTGSADLPVTPGAYDVTYGGAGPALTDAWIARFQPLGAGVVFATYLGGSSIDEARAIGLSNGSPVIAGRTESAAFPVTAGAFDQTFGGGLSDAFVARLTADGAQLTMATFVGGSERESLDALTTMPNGDYFVAGFSRSINVGIAVGPDLQPGGLEDGMMLAFSPTDVNTWGVYLGGSADDRILSIAVDSTGATYYTGRTASTDYPAQQQAYDPTPNGGTDGFFTKLRVNGQGYNETGYLGGAGYDEGRAIAVAASGVARIAGRTTSTAFPITAGALQSTPKGSSDGFVAYLPTAVCSNQPLVTTYGAGKAGSTGVPSLSALNLPAVPSTSFMVRLSGALPGAVPILFVGFATAALPFDNGTILVNPLMILTLFPIAANGRLDLPVPIGEDAGLCGVKVDMQALYTDPGATGFYHTAQTNGLEVLFGSN